MAAFSLTKGADTFDFGLDGSVTKGGSAAGTWATNQGNQIVVTAADGTQNPIDAGWQFNQDNQLCLFSGANQVFDFHQGTANPPFYQLSDKAVLQVFPDQTGNFSFNLHGAWQLAANHNLSLTLNGQASTIDGYVEDEQSRFVFYFFDKKLPFSFNLVFIGKWDSAVNQQGVLAPTFQYATEDGKTSTFSLPGEITNDRSINQFVYQYDKDGHSRRITFMGILNVTPDFQLKYTLDRQTDDSGNEQVASTTFNVSAVFKSQDFSGDVEFVVKKTDGTTGSTTIGIKGNFTATLGNTRLMVGYGFTMVRGQETVDTSFFFNGTLAIKDNAQVQWQFQANAQSFTIGIAAQDIKIGNARADARLNITGQGGQVGVYALFGIAF